MEHYYTCGLPARRHAGACGVSIVVILALQALGAVWAAPGQALGSSLWSNSATPSAPSYYGKTSYELGVRFTSDVAGTITGLRFYKSAQDRDPHVGHLWSGNGALLATINFSNETASGWQQVALARPVAIKAGTVYVASFSDTSGYYALSRYYFSTTYNKAPLHAPAGTNGVFSRTPGTFPNQGFESTNYWADVVFLAAASDPPSPAGTATLTVRPSSLSFGNVLVGSKSLLPIVLTDTGTNGVTISKITASGAGFSESSSGLPLTLAAGGNATVTVTFAPTTAGAATGSISVVSNASNSPTVTALGGTGANKHSVSLTWAASASSGVLGYNVYRGTVSGGPYTKLNSALLPSTSYTDSSAAGGQTYYYVATSVSSTGVQSGYSNQATAVVPSP